jgi:hypothetical protein
MPQSIQMEPDGLNRAQRRALASDERRIKPRFVSIHDACDYLGCSRSHFYAALLSEVRTIALGKRRLVDFASLEQLGDKLLAAGQAVAEGTTPTVPTGALGGQGGLPAAGHRPNIVKTACVARGARK